MLIFPIYYGRIILYRLGECDMKKGFTLIELLAVIVILAIIAAISVPIVLNIIDDSNINSIKTSASMYLKSVNLYISNAELNKSKISPGIYPITSDGDICIGILNEQECNGEVIKIEVKGNKPSSGKVKIDQNSNIELEDIEISGYVYNEKKVEKTIKELKESDNGLIILESSKVSHLKNYRIYGNDISPVGDLVTDENNEHYGKYKISIKVSGKNLYSADEVYYNFQNNILETELSYTITYFQLKPNTTYYLKAFNPVTSTSGNFYIHKSSVVNSISGMSPLDESRQKYPRPNEKSFTTNDTGRIYFGYYAVKGTTLENILRDSKIFIVEGSYDEEIVPDYESYVEPKYYDIYLDEPLRCIGDVCDYIDYESGKVVRNIDDDVLSNPAIKNIELPRIDINEKTSNIFIDTNIKPSKVSVTYYK